MSGKSYLVKNHKIANRSTTAGAREKISTDLESLKCLDIGFIKFKHYQILLNKISHIFLVTTE
jgi:hypothetical protein